MCSAETVYRVDTDSDVYFYSTLTTADVIFGGSAVCAFTLSSINQVFSYFLNKKKKTLLYAGAVSSQMEFLMFHHSNSFLPNLSYAAYSMYIF